ncbi:MAG: T9SS type A sorting domain-containing protein [Bacteroidota bacterium]|nr:T9SS type A sorting domain-containing protein [Bacteroidota bacterium]
MKNRINFLLLYVTGALLLVSPSMQAQRQLLIPSGQTLPGKNIQLHKPDPSALLNIRKKAINGQVQVLNFDKLALQENKLMFTLPSGEKVVGIMEEKDQRTEDDFSWHGHLQGRASSVVFTFQNGRMAGNLVLGEKNYILAPLDQGTSVFYEKAVLKYANEFSPKTFKTPEIPSSENDHSGAIRLLVAFTPSAEKEIELMGYNNPKLFIQQFISEINQAYISRGLQHRVALAVALPLDYSESGNLNQDLDRFENATDGFMDNIFPFRKLYNADVSLLLTNNLKLSDLTSGMKSKENSAFFVVNYDRTLGNNLLANEIGRLHANNAWALNNTADDKTISSASPEVLHLNNTANLPDKAAGFVTATSEIVLEPGFETSENSDLRLEVTPSLSPSSPIAARKGKESDKEFLGTEISNESVLNVSPIPTYGEVNIEVNFSKETEATIDICDIRGAQIKKVYKGRITHKRFNVDLSQEAQGIYFINCRAMGKVFSERALLTK